MKNLLLLFLAVLLAGQAQAQFFEVFGEAGLNFRASQIKPLNGNTYVSGWFSDASTPNSGPSEEGIIFRLDANGDLDWVYNLSAETPQGVRNGTRIYDFDFSDSEEQIVFVGATNFRVNPQAGNFLDNECVLGMISIGTGAEIFQQAYNFRSDARELFLRITNNPATGGILDNDRYFISGAINDPGFGAGVTDNYIAARAEITPSGVSFDWINEHNYAIPPPPAGQTTPDQEIHRMRVLAVGNGHELVFGGIENPGSAPANRNNAQINFHNPLLGTINGEFIFNRNGTVLDVAQLGNLMIVVGQLSDDPTTQANQGQAFITGVDLNSRSVVTNSIIFPSSELNRFSRIEIEPISGDILVIGERSNNANSVICRFTLAPFAALLSLVNASVIDFGTDGSGEARLEIDNNEAYWVDTRIGMNTLLPPTEESASVVRTDLTFNSCETVSLELSPSPVQLELSEIMAIEIAALEAEPEELEDEPVCVCLTSLCEPLGVGMSFTSTIIPHGTDAEYVKVADINRDGWMDFGLPDRRFSNTPQFTICENNQNQTFTSINSSTGNTPSYTGEGEAIAFFDLFGGSKLDIVLLRQPVIEIYRWDQLSGGNYVLQQTIPVTTFAPPNNGNILGQFRSDFELMDYNGDGIEDLVATGTNTGNAPQTSRIVVFAGTNNFNTPFLPNPIAALEGLNSISYWETVHLNIDNQAGNDILVGQAGFGGNNQSIFGYLHTGNNTPNNIFLNAPDLLYETPAGLIWPRGLELHDIDGNSQNDLITAMQCEQLINNIPSGNGALLISRDVPTAAGNYPAANLNWEILPIPGQPVGIDIGDIDGDGDDDIVVAVHYPMSFVRIYENNGNGNFFNFVDVNTPGGRTTEVKIEDFNKDCCMDIVTAQWASSFSYILTNNCQSDQFAIRGEVRCENNPCNFNSASPAPNQMIQITAGGTTYYAMTDNNGQYEILVPAGTYDISLVNGNYGPAVCSFNQNNVYTNDITGFTPTSGISTVNFVVDEECSLDVNMVGDIVGSVGTNNCPYVATPCEDLIWEYCFEIENNTCTDRIIDNVIIDLPNGVDMGSVIINPIVACGTQTQVSTGSPSVGTYTGSDPLFGSTVSYNFSPPITIAAGQCFNACVEATFDGSFTLPIKAQADAIYRCGRTNQIASSTVSYQDTCSCDPNLKLAYFPQNCGNPDEVLNQPIEYTIQFSNIGQTAAYDILVEDQLDINLDWSTFQWLGSSHTAGPISITNGLLEVYFNNINLAPGAMGWFRFSVKPDASSTNGTVITNYADITFDNNAPVPTNTTTTTINFSTASADLQINATEFCVGDTVIIDYLWTGTSAELNFTQNGVAQGQNIPAPPSGTQVVFVIPDASYVGLWEYDLVAFDSITGCTDTASLSFTINDCACDLDDELFMELLDESVYRFTSNLFDPTLNPGMTILEFHWSLGDGTNSTEENPFHRYDCRGLGSRTVKVCLYYIVEVNGKICEAEVCEFFEVCLDEPVGGGRAQLYPNPATNQVTIQADAFLDWDEPLVVEIYTADGKLLRTHELVPDYNRLTLTLNYDYEGLVHVRVRSKLGEVLLEERFIKVNP
ncbi:MAG: FG-GAP-like repeat-containing protein [Bacteroidota bacterium]